MLARNLEVAATQASKTFESDTLLADIIPLPIAEASTSTPEEGPSGIYNFPDSLNPTLIDSQYSADETRPHQLLRAVVEGTRHSFWLTEAKGGQTPRFTILNSPALGEVIEKGVGFEFHKSLADLLPDSRVITLGTSCFGRSAELPTPRQFTALNMDRLATVDRQFIDVLPEDSWLIMVATSMATVVHNKMLVNGLRSGKPLLPAQLIYLYPALVVPEHARWNMLRRFPPQFLVNCLRELQRAENPRQYFDNNLTALRSLPGPMDLLTTGRLAHSLTEGTPREEIELVLGEYLLSVIVGDRDSVGQPKMWQELAFEHPDTLDLCLLEGRGHALALKPHAKARKVASTIIKADIHYDFAM